MSHIDTAAPQRPAPGITYALIAAGLLVVAGAAAFTWASVRRAAETPVEPTVAVSVDDKVCEPMALVVPAGRTVFAITNASGRSVEWEILDGVMIVAERENITPGLTSRLVARLRPGTYEITCGLLSNPRGTLTVTETAASQAEAAKPSLAAFVGPVAEDRVTLRRGAKAFAVAATTLSAAIDAGDLAAARSAYVEARLAFRPLVPLAGRFGDLARALDGRPEDYAGGVDDPAFAGFHRLEHGLYAKGSLDGLEAPAQRFAADAATFADTVAAAKRAPEDLARGDADLARQIGEADALARRNPWSGSDAAEFSADLDAIVRTMGSLMPLLADAAPDVATEVETRTAAARAAISAFTTDEEAARAPLAAAFTALADALDRVNPALGLE